jgi:hypothetical protein
VRPNLDIDADIDSDVHIEIDIDTDIGFRNEKPHGLASA